MRAAVIGLLALRDGRRDRGTQDSGWQHVHPLSERTGRAVPPSADRTPGRTTMSHPSGWFRPDGRRSSGTSPSDKALSRTVR